MTVRHLALPRAERRSLEAEALRALRFLEPAVGAHDVELVALA
jgi:hypothetical protein